MEFSARDIFAWQEYVWGMAPFITSLSKAGDHKRGEMRESPLVLPSRRGKGSTLNLGLKGLKNSYFCQKVQGYNSCTCTMGTMTQNITDLFYKEVIFNRNLFYFTSKVRV